MVLRRQAAGNLADKVREVLFAPRPPQFKTIFGIQLEHFHSGPSRGGLAKQQQAAPLEVIFPTITAGMEQLGKLTGLRIVASHVARLVEIALDTRQGQIIWLIGPAMLSRANVLNVQDG